MTRKRILAICLVFSLITGAIAMTTSCGLQRVFFSNSGVGAIINSDGNTYPPGAPESATVLAELPEGERLPLVENRETLLKLLMDRGAFYDPSQDIYLYATDDFVMLESDALPAPVPDAVPAAPAEAPEAAAEAPAPSALSPTDNAAQPDSENNHSETNEQVAGVSEGDIVKTDGRYLYAMSMHDNRLRIIRADGANLKIVSTISFDGIWGTEFYIINNDRLAVVGGEHVRIQPLPGSSDQPSTRAVPEYHGLHESSFTTLVIYDISDRADPSELRRVSMDGWSLSTRVMDGIVYLVTTKHLWGIPINHADSPYIMPYSRDTAESAEYEPLSFDSIYYVPGTSDTSYLLVGAVDVYDDAAFEPTAYLGAGSNLYMSRSAMYITQYRWEEAQSSGNDAGANIWRSGREKTDIMRFAINKTEINYTGKGVADGSPINQYSMDEFNGFFRIATTDWTDGTYVTVLDASDMKTVGRTEPLAPGEQMHSMRFMGDMGYVVTFLNVDPLFTIDLSDPYNPKMLGELKMPGFSQYLHPVGDGLLLGIGRDTQEIYTRDANGNETVVGFNDAGMRVTLFNVKNPFNPREVDVLKLGEGWTEVSHNPRALMCDSGRSIYGFITESWDFSGSYKSNAVLLRIENERLSVASTLDLDTNRGAWGSRMCFIGDSLYNVHNTGITVYDYNSFEKLGSMAF